MVDAPQIPQIAALLADQARANMVWSLIDGTTRPAGELAFAANVSAQSATAHLAKLVAGGLLVAEAQGRHRYFRIANSDAAHMIESMASFGALRSPRIPPHPKLVRDMPSHFLHARTCYDHLAGEVAVKVLEAMLKRKWLFEDGMVYKATRLGQKELAALGVDMSTDKSIRRVFARSCIDLTQRRPHLAGVLGASMLDFYVREGWILRSKGSRIVSVTPKGRVAFGKVLGVDI
jgi:DNA-binding transcriptional ArsR family regulator